MERYRGNNMDMGGSTNMGYGYTSYSPSNVDYNVLIKLGFKGDEIDLVNQVASQFGKVTTDRVSKLTGNSLLASKVNYLYSVICCKDSHRALESINIIRKSNMICDSTDEITINAMLNLAAHYKKMYSSMTGGNRAIFNKTLPRPKLGEVPKKAIVGGIKDEIFIIYNSNRYLVKDRLYDVVSYNDVNTTIRTNRLPVLKNGVQAKVEGVADIKKIVEKKTGADGYGGASGTKEAIIAINNKYTRICNRYIIAASTHRPNLHCGMMAVICLDGTVLYVYAVELRGMDKVNGGVDVFTGQANKYKENSSNRVVYDYGYRACDIEQKIEAVSRFLYKGVRGLMPIKIRPQHSFEEGCIQREKPTSVDEVSSKY